MPDNNSQLQMLKQEIESLKAEFYRGNFTGSQDYTKKVRMQTAFRHPVYASSPAKCEIGESYVNSGNGKLYVCSSANTWTAQT